MGIFENDAEYAEAEREGWLVDGRLTAAGKARLDLEDQLAAENPGVDPRTLGRS